MVIRYRMEILVAAFAIFVLTAANHAALIMTADEPAQLEICAAGKHSLRVTLKPVAFDGRFPFTPALAERRYAPPAITLRELGEPITARVGTLNVEVRPNPLTVIVTNVAGDPIQDLIFQDDGKLSFKVGDHPLLGMGEGGPQPGQDWRAHTIEFDRRGRVHEMRPRWQANAYGSRNPVSLMVGTAGWGLFVATPWGQLDLLRADRGTFSPWEPPPPPQLDERDQRGEQRRRYSAQIQGRPPIDSVVPGVYDLFIFDAHEPTHFMKDVSTIVGPAVMPPKWSLGYMQSHRTLEDHDKMIEVVDTFRQKQIPLDAVIYLGTGFCPRGWNTRQPSFDFNPEVFQRDPSEVIDELHDRNVKIIVHVVPWQRDRLPTLQGTIPPQPGETRDASHLMDYWQQHCPLFEAGIDAFWPDEGDWFNLFERIKRHQLYYQGPLSTRPNIRPWSLHRNGHLGIAQWGGWVWSGDTDASWKTLEGQVAVGINHSLSLSPYWGSDIGGFYPNEELTGELYARWFQFAAFCPSFRSHGRTWWTRLPWGWGLSDMGPRESQRNPRESELNNPAIEPICRRYAELRYQLMPYTYSLAWQARDSGLPLMRTMWLHYPDDAQAWGLGSQYLWGRDLLVAPVFTQGATTRDVYLPQGKWYDWWTNDNHSGGQSVTRKVDLASMPIYVRAGAIIPFDPVRQYAHQTVDEPTTLKIYRGADGQFTMYDDDGISLDYLDGQAMWTRVTWNDAEGRLTIEPGGPEGTTNRTSTRTFHVELLPAGDTKRVEYNGKRVEVTLPSGAATSTEDSEPSALVYTRLSKPEDGSPPDVIRVEPISDALRSEYELASFYKKVAAIDNIPIIGSENVSDYAILECAWIVDHMLDGSEKIKHALVDSKVRIGVIAATEYTMDIPENQRPGMMARAAFHDRRSRGLGGRTYTTCGEENLLSLHGDPYRLENITIHEFAHTIASNLRRVDPEWWDRLSDLYRRATDEGLWESSYAGTNVQEYWAEGTQSWFDCNTPRDDGRVHNGIWNRDRLKKYDPRLAKFLTETFGDGQWRYSKSTARPAKERAHLAGLDRDQLPTFNFQNSPRVQAENAEGGSSDDTFDKGSEDR